jgi:hypothetical protein
MNLTFHRLLSSWPGTLSRHAPAPFPVMARLVRATYRGMWRKGWPGQAEP